MKAQPTSAIKEYRRLQHWILLQVNSVEGFVTHAENARKEELIRALERSGWTEAEIEELNNDIQNRGA